MFKYLLSLLLISNASALTNGLNGGTVSPFLPSGILTNVAVIDTNGGITYGKPTNGTSFILGTGGSGGGTNSGPVAATNIFGPTLSPNNAPFVQTNDDISPTGLDPSEQNPNRYPVEMISWRGQSEPSDLTGNTTESNVLISMTNLMTSPLWGQGYNYLIVGDGWWYGASTNGQLLWNSNRFPHGPNIIQTLHSNHCKIVLYFDDSPTNLYSPIVPMFGSNNYVGYIPQAYYSNYMENLHQWGVDGIIWDNIYANSYTNADYTKIHTKWWYYWHNKMCPEIPFFSFGSGNFNFDNIVATGAGTNMSTLLNWPKAVNSNWFGSTTVSQTHKFLPYRANNSDAMYVFADANANSNLFSYECDMIAWQCLGFMYPNKTLLGSWEEGGSVWNPTIPNLDALGKMDVGFQALFHGPFGLQGEGFTVYPQLLYYLTNSLINSIQRDSLQDRLHLLQDFGNSNLVFSERLSGGRYALAFLNAGLTPQVDTLNLGLLGIGSNITVTITDAWHGTNIWTSNTFAWNGLTNNCDIFVISFPPDPSAFTSSSDTTILGANNIGSSTFQVVYGSHDTVGASQSVTFGRFNSVTGGSSMAIGANENDGGFANSAMFGYNDTATYFGQYRFHSGSTHFSMFYDDATGTPSMVFSNGIHYGNGAGITNTPIHGTGVNTNGDGSYTINSGSGGNSNFFVAATNIVNVQTTGGTGTTNTISVANTPTFTGTTTISNNDGTSDTLRVTNSDTSFKVNQQSFNAVTNGHNRIAFRFAGSTSYYQDISSNAMDWLNGSASIIWAMDTNGNVSANSFTGNGAPLTNLNIASNNTTGVLSDASLSANVPLLNKSNNFQTNILVTLGDTTTNRFYALSLVNTNAATATTVAPSPGLYFQSSTWNTTTPASVPAGFLMYNSPLIGAGDTANLNIDWLTNTGTSNKVVTVGIFKLGQTGNLTVVGGVAAGGGIGVGSQNTVSWNTGYIFGNATTGDQTGAIRIVSGNATSSLNFGGDTASFPSLIQVGSGINLVGANGVYSSSNSFMVPGTITATNGFSSLATNTATMASTGLTNVGANDLQVFSFTGTSVTYTNTTGTNTASLGTITVGQTFTLKKGWAVIGTGCAAAYVEGR